MSAMRANCAWSISNAGTNVFSSIAYPTYFSDDDRSCLSRYLAHLVISASDRYFSFFFPALKSARYQPPVPQRTRQDRHSVSRYATFYSFNRIPINCTHTHTECRLEFHYVPMDTIISRASINCPNSPHGLFYFENSTATEIRLKFFLLPRFLSRNDRFRG